MEGEKVATGQRKLWDQMTPGEKDQVTGKFRESWKRIIDGMGIFLPGQDQDNAIELMTLITRSYLDSPNDFEDSTNQSGTSEGKA